MIEITDENINNALIKINKLNPSVMERIII